MIIIKTELTGRLDDVQRERLAALADVLIPGGAGLPSASVAKVQGKWIDRALAVRADLEEVVLAVLARDGDAASELEKLRKQDPETFKRFTFAVSGAYLMNPSVHKLFGYPGNAPRPSPAYPDEADGYLEDGILHQVVDRGPIYRSTPPTA